MPYVYISSNTIKFLVGSLVGAVIMMLVDMNEMFVQLEKQSPSSSRAITFVPNPSTLRHNSNQFLRAPERLAQETSLGAVNPHVELMKQNPRLSRSALQCGSVWRKKDALPLLFDRDVRFDTDQGEYGGVILSDEWAFLHVWVNGDRTVIKVAEDQLEETQHRKDFTEVRNRKWMALVQDPIQHFLEGWALTELKLVQEFQDRDHGDLASRIVASWEASDMSYDDRVSEFLDRVKKYSTKAATATLSPMMHALPQTNFLLDDVGQIHPNIEMIGDVSEWKAMMELAGFQKNADLTHLDQTPTLQSKYFPSEVNRLSRDTIIKLCDFLAMDYYLLSYDAPTACLKKNGPLDFPHRRLIQHRKLHEEEGEYS